MAVTGDGIVVALCLCMHMTLLGSYSLFYYLARPLVTSAYLTAQAVAILFYPLLGYLADVCFTRYRFIEYSFKVMTVGSLLLLVSVCLASALPGHQFMFLIPGSIAVILCLLAIGMFKSTALQFGLDQLLEAPSRRLSKFIHWYYWASVIGHLIIGVCGLALLLYFSHCHIEISSDATDNTLTRELYLYQCKIGYIMMTFMSALMFTFSCAGLSILFNSKGRLNIDRKGHSPWVTVYRVLRYAWKHKCPENRSAFTYWEEDVPPRIDLGKSKYGGPFTTEEVEDTKTLFSILQLMVCILGYQLMGHSYSFLREMTSHSCPPYWMMVVSDPMIVVVLITALTIPLTKLIPLTTCCSAMKPNLLKRIGIGLACSIAKELTLLVIKLSTTGTDCNRSMISCYFQTATVLESNGTCTPFNEIVNSSACHDTQHRAAYSLFVVPVLLQALSDLLVFMTMLEFICAQSPLRMKGMLVGVWYASLAINYFTEVSQLFTVGITWEVFQGVKITIMFAFFISYLFVSRHYRYRQRNEVVNEQFLIEEVYERRLDQEQEYQRRMRKAWRKQPFNERFPLLVNEELDSLHQ